MARHEKFDVNEATQEELSQIPGVGDATAQAIIDFRESRGRIDDISQLAEAKQINPRDIDQLREWLTAGPEEEEEEEEEETKEGEMEEEDEESEGW